MIEYTEDQLRWLNGLAAFDSWNERIALSTFAFLGIPKSYLDIGSGDGAMANIARRLGVDAWGVDILPREESHLVLHDLRQPLDLGRQFDLVSCIEVAEHIPPENDITIVETIVRHVAPGGTLVFTAAHPGQAGDGHVNCRPAEHWRKQFYDRGLSYSEDITHRLAFAWMCVRSPMGHLMDNLQVFVK